MKAPAKKLRSTQIMEKKEKRQTLLVVDDIPENISVVKGILKDDFRIKVALNGKKALEIAQSGNPPDLILLDIMMPDMNGYQVCQILKSNGQTRDIPIIFLTAKSDVVDESKGLEMGAVDYITKPIEPTILQTRVDTQLSLLKQRRKLKENYHALQEAESSRDALVHMIVHDLRNPLNSVLGYMDLIEMQMENGNYSLEDCEKYLQTIQGSAREMELLIEEILHVSKLESGTLNPKIEVQNAVELAEEVCHQMTPSGGREIDFSPSRKDLKIRADRPLTRRILQNFLSNAIKYTPRNSTVHFHLAEEKGMILFTVCDEGEGIPEEYRSKVFDKFFQIGSKNNKRGTGLGLTFCKMAAEIQGGEVSVKNGEGELGACFRLALPKGDLEPI